MQKNGLAKGGTLDNAVVIKDGKILILNLINILTILRDIKL